MVSWTDGIGAAGAPVDERTRLHRLEGDGALAGLRVECWALREALDEPWRLELSCLAADAGLDPAAMVGAAATLLTRLADGSDCARGGIVTEAWAEDADGGLARYRLVVEPWLALLAHGTHSRVWQDKTVVEVVEAVFAGYAGHAAWRWSAEVPAFVAESAQAGRRAYTVQYRESDLAFVSRLLAREGLGCRFERAAEAPLGHALVIFADSTRAEACPEDAMSASTLGGAGLRYHGTGPVQAQDAIQALGGLRRLPAMRVATLAWDDVAQAAVAAVVPTAAACAGAEAPALEDYDAPGTHLDGADAERAATLMQQAREARHKTWFGRGTVRSFGAGTFFRLTDSDLDLFDLIEGRGGDARDRRFLLSAVTHAGINNLPRPAAEAAAALPAWVPAEVRAQAEASGYGNAFEALRAAVPWRPQTADGTGTRRHPLPRVSGMLTATVVGAAGETTAAGADEIHMDRLGRVRIAFDFQRRFAGAGTAPASTWVRVLQRWAGPGIGSQWVPRLGQEVLVDFVEGDIERPLVVGALYDGRGEAGVPATPGGAAAEADPGALALSNDHAPGAQANLSGGHAPAWHGAGAAALAAGGQANAAALSGHKSREFGGAGFNQLVFDDSDSQLRAQLHTSQHASQLNLGHLVHQADNHRGSFRGLGFELRSDAYGALRGNAGLLLSTFGTPPQAPAGDNAAGIALQSQLAQMCAGLSQAAMNHQTVTLAAERGSTQASRSALSDRQAPAQALLTALKGMVDESTLDAAQADAARRHTGTGEGKLPHAAAPVVAIAARGGLVASAGQDLQWSAGEGLVVASGEDTHVASGGAARIHTGQAIGLLAGAVGPGSEAQGRGLTLIAAQGDVEVQAQSSTLQVAARGDVAIQSARAGIDWAAATKITLATAGGASVTIEAAGITVACPGKITVKASLKSFAGAEAARHELPLLPKGDLTLQQQMPFSL